MDTMVHPDDEELIASMVDFGLERLKTAKAIYCLASEHQVALNRVLWQRGFESVSEYVTLVKSIAAKVKEGSRVRATVAST